MVLKRLSEAGGRGAGGFVGGILNNPGTVAILAIVAALIIFRGDIRTFFGTTIPEAISGIGSVEFPDITFPTFEFPEITFPEITFPEFPEFPDFTSIFQQFFDLLGGGMAPIPPPPGEVPSPIGPITTPEGCTVDEQGIIRCPTPPTFDVCDQFPELCEPCLPGETRIGGICQPMEPITPPIAPPIPPGPILPPGFVGGGPSFEGGIIFERDVCFMTLNEIINAGLASSASEAANIRAIACSQNVTEEPFDIPDFEPTPTQESEAKRAACTSCELFGLNCPICRGELTNGFA